MSGREIPRALYAQLRRQLAKVVIVTPFLEDYEFFGRNPLSALLLKHLSEGTEVTLLTMPPEGTNGTRRAFTRKFRLMESLAIKGVDVLFNTKLHAKVFLFDLPGSAKASILGSANLTSAAMNDRLEIAILTYNRTFYSRVLSVVWRFRSDSSTTTFSQWRLREASKIRAATGELQHGQDA